MQATLGEVLEIEVFDYDLFGTNDLLGRCSIDIAKEVATAPKGDLTKTWALRDVPTEMFAGGEPAVAVCVVVVVCVCVCVCVCVWRVCVAGGAAAVRARVWFPAPFTRR